MSWWDQMPWSSFSKYNISVLRACVLSHVWLFATPWTVAHRLLYPWNFPGKNTGVVLQGIFLTQGSNPHLISPSLVGRFFTTNATLEAHYLCFKTVHLLSCVQLFVTSWTVAHQASLSRRFPRQEYCSGLPFPSPLFFNRGPWMLFYILIVRLFKICI